MFKNIYGFTLGSICQKISYDFTKKDILENSQKSQQSTDIWFFILYERYTKILTKTIVL